MVERYLLSLGWSLAADWSHPPASRISLGIACCRSANVICLDLLKSLWPSSWSCNDNYYCNADDKNDKNCSKIDINDSLSSLSHEYSAHFITHASSFDYQKREMANTQPDLAVRCHLFSFRVTQQSSKGSRFQSQFFYKCIINSQPGRVFNTKDMDVLQQKLHCPGGTTYTVHWNGCILSFDIQLVLGCEQTWLKNALGYQRGSVHCHAGH